MYIGPWQEYNLAKKSQQRVVDASLKPDIEYALMRSLDPEAARIALEAMRPYFDASSANMPTRPRLPLGSTPMHARSIRRRYSNAPDPPRNSSFSPTIASARARAMQSASPLSVRSTQSEPIHFSDSLVSNASTGQRGYPSPRVTPLTLPALQAQNQRNAGHQQSPKISVPPLQEEPSRRQPPYNSPAMLNFLKLERGYQAQARSKISTLTGWKTNVDSFAADASEKRRKVNAQVSNDDKVAQVSNMKRLYMNGNDTGETECSASNVRLPPLRNLSAASLGDSENLSAAEHAELMRLDGRVQPKAALLSSLTYASPSRTKGQKEPMLLSASHIESPSAAPRIDDIELDEEAFGKISKYFQISASIKISADIEDNPPPKPMQPTSKNGSGQAMPSTLDGARDEATLSFPSSSLNPIESRRLDSQIMRSSPLPRLISPRKPDVKAGNHSPPMHGRNKNALLSDNSPRSVGKEDAKSSSNRVSPSSPPLLMDDEDEDTPNLDELYIGGVDGLLKWSSQLELDYNTATI